MLVPNFLLVEAVLNLLGSATKNLGRVRDIFRGFLVRWLIIFSGGQCGRGLRVESGLRIRQGFHAGVRIGACVYIGKDTTIDSPAGGVLCIADDVTLTQGIFISAAQSVRIGKGTMIGEYCSIRDSNHGTDLSSPMKHQPLILASVEVGGDVWIGRGCAILAGVTVGDGAVIGANAVVTRNVDQCAIVGGIPAKLIRFRN